ncbi:polysaccharide biosynthesis tyrosine autokinase [Acinetobacter soli]|uniref:polysaccharide biosynthesis tyrosine autokinase n=1 Tax=Acinetobacter soli TaxID=487316 RepID=UPI00125CE651|nr:polysaccharide biosynthesis tyrosine autokinase [Acinetobacter soli]MCF3128343.1 polysaccharide biosynthesis tyrosine autokinase [Acinetobacter soli]
MSQNSKIHDDTIDLKELLFSLISQWKLIFICILISLICALIYLRVTPDIYSTDALVQVEDSKSAASKALLGELGDLSGAVSQKSPADAEIEILNSRLVLGNVIENLNLNIQIKDTEDTLFNRLFNHLAAQVNYSSKGLEYKTAQGAFFIEKFIVPDYYLDKNLILKLNEQNQQFYLTYKDQKVLSGTLNKENVITDAKGTWIVKINSKSSFDQEFAITKLTLPSAIKSISQNYGVAERGKMTGVIGLTYQGEDPAHITQVLNNILKVYHAQNIERKSLESQQTLSFLDKQLPELKKQVEESEVKFNKFREQYNTVDVTQESELLLKQNVALETTKIELKQKQAEFAAKYTNDHPLMAEINAQLDAVNKKSAELNATIKRLPELQRQYLQLYRDVKVNTELYTSLLNNYQQLKVANAGEIGNVRVIDTAIEPVKPIKPKKLMILILSIFVGGFIGVMWALLRKMLRTGIKDSAQIENELDLPVYATVPRSPIQESRIKLLKKSKSIPILSIKNSDDIAIESLRSMRTAIHFALANAKNNLIMIAGPAPEVGKSFVSVNLAAILAQSNKRVLLIDADLRRGYLNKYFNVEIKPGLSEYLSDQASFDSIIHHSEVAGLDMITRGKSPANPSEMLGSAKFKAFLDEIMQHYDHVLIDTPPVLAVTDSIIISQYAGVNLIIARHNKTQMKELELTVSRFEQAGVKVNGFILNDIQKSSGGYGYNYAYSYTAAKDD